jgi:hypothetical protein
MPGKPSLNWSFPLRMADHVVTMQKFGANKQVLKKLAFLKQ